jgi:hypothetical protein
MHRAEPTVRDAGTTWAVLINGGGSPARNYQSHLLHLRRMHRLMIEGGLLANNIFVFASDGADPAPDLAVIDSTDDDWWLLGAAPLARKFAPQTELVNSTVEGVEVRPATKRELGAGFAELAHAIQPGDTLLLYVTDHGWRDPVST